MGFHEAAFTTSVVSEEVAAAVLDVDAVVESDDSELLEHALKKMIDRAAVMLKIALVFTG